MDKDIQEIIREIDASEGKYRGYSIAIRVLRSGYILINEQEDIVFSDKEASELFWELQDQLGIETGTVNCTTYEDGVPDYDGIYNLYQYGARSKDIAPVFVKDGVVRDLDTLEKIDLHSDVKYAFLAFLPNWIAERIDATATLIDEKEPKS